MLFSYTNCSNQHDQPSSESSASSAAAKACQESAKAVFRTSLYPFVRARCAVCHTAAGGRPPFADPSFDTAFPAGIFYSPDQFRSNSISATHAPGITGPSLETQAQQAYDAWKPAFDEMKACVSKTANGTAVLSVPDWSEAPPQHAGLPDPGVARFDLASKLVGLTPANSPQGADNYDYTPAMSSPARTIVWGLGGCSSPQSGNEILSSPPGSSASFPCAQLQVSLRSFRNRVGQTGYLISDPRLITSTTQSLQISSLLFRINGYYITDGTAYKYILNRQVFMGGQVLNPRGESVGMGSLVAFGPVKPTDQISVTIGALENINMAPPPPLPRVEFSLAAQRVLESSDTPSTVTNLDPRVRFTIVPVTIRLDRAPADAPVTVTVGLDTNAMNQLPDAVRARPFRPLNPQNNPNNHPVWDYRMGPASDTDPNMPLNYRKDDEVVSVTFYPAVGSAPAETSKNVIITIARDHRREGGPVGADPRVESLILRLSAPTRAQFGTQQTQRIDIVDDDNALQPGEPSFAVLVTTGVLGTKCVACHNSTMAAGGYDVTDYYRMIDRGVLISGDPRSKMYQRMNGDDPAVQGLTPMPPPEQGGFLRYDERAVVENWIVLAGARNN